MYRYSRTGGGERSLALNRDTCNSRDIHILPIEKCVVEEKQACTE